MSEKHVFIPTRGRYRDIGKLCNTWLKKDFEVHLVVEAAEYSRYFMATAYIPDVHTIILPMSNMGIAYSRDYALRQAHEMKLKSIIMSDDDIKPSTRRYDGMADILEACEHPKVLGVTARYGYHDLCLGQDIKYMDELVLLSTGTFRLVGLNVQNAIDLGGYNTKLMYAEDCDLFLRGLQKGFPWLVHLGSYANSLGSRYEPGGMIDFVAQTDEENNMDAMKRIWHREIHNEWPMVTNNHTDKCAGKQNCIKVYWKRAYDEYLPDWRDWSDLDGGSLEVYLNA